MAYRLDDTLGFAVYRVAARLRAELSQRLRGHDLTSEQFGLLARLWEEDGISQRVLAERNFKDRPNVTRMLDKLEHKALVVRRPDPDDRRAYNVYLTARGRGIRDELLGVVARLCSDAYRGISPEEQRHLRHLLDRVFDNLSPATGTPSAAGGA